MAYKVFISHPRIDKWVASQIRDKLENTGINTFLDDGIDIGDDFEEVILVKLKEAQELVVLFTPWALDSPYVWLEIGAAWFSGIRIVAILYGLSNEELIAKTKNPILIKKKNFLQLNDFDRYLEELNKRVSTPKTFNT